ncbi:uncharacterized protein LOC126847897 [Adelges cooleyi]|uniref:uncharacterized protein LOC126847897 n=1 Tax=Adelges cooleyi TaxID=133065 RepID=UPI00217F3031|nr:uncharacterized protein LOC126847897 [Adelges cooleyi]
MFVLEIFLVVFIASLADASVFTDGVFLGQRSRCPPLRVPNGRLRARSGNRVVRITCLFPYKLVQGNDYATCIGGEWDTPPPICARPGCAIPEGIDHGRINILESGARLDLECDVGYALDGPSSVYCTKDKEWNEELYDCKAHDHIYVSCDFESADERFCGWKNDMYNDIDWLADKVKLLLFSSNRHVPPGSSQYFSGSYISLDAGRLSPSSSGKLLSPQLPPTKNKQRCVTFSYKIVVDEGRTRPSLIVSYGGIPHWSKIRGEGRASIGLYRVDFAAKITIEGKGCMAAIDNMVITEGDSCLIKDGGDYETCEDNCGKAAYGNGCSCNWECHQNSNCCPDIGDHCPYIKTPEEISVMYTTTTTHKPIVKKKPVTPIAALKSTNAATPIPTSNVTYPQFPSTIPTLEPTAEPITITVTVPTTTTTTTPKPTTSSTTTPSPTTTSTTTTTPKPTTSATTTPPPTTTSTTTMPSIINTTVVIKSTKPEMTKPNISHIKYLDVTSGPNKTVIVIDITSTETPSPRMNRISKNNNTNIPFLFNVSDTMHRKNKHNVSTQKSQTDNAGPETKTEFSYILFNKRMDAADQWVAPQVKQYNDQHNTKSSTFNTSFIFICIALGIGLVTLMYTIYFGKLCFKKSFKYRVDNNLDQSDGDTASNLELITNDEL